MSNITTDNIKLLREKTGAGMMDCKKALLENKGDMAIGSGLRFPLVISTSIREYALFTLSKKNKIKNRIFFILLTFLLRQNLTVSPSIFHIQ